MDNVSGQETPTGARRALRVAVTVAVAHYSTTVTIWFVCLLAARDGWWPLILANFAVIEPIVPAAPLLVAAMLVGGRRLVMAATLPLLIFGFLYWPYLVPDLDDGRPAQQPGSGQVRLMTYNVLNNNDDVAAIAAVIVHFEPDVVAVQELTEEMEPRLISALADSHPHYEVASPTRGGTTALFSRTALLGVDEIDFGIDRPALMASVIVDGHEVIVASAHLLPAYYALNENSRSELPGAIGDYLADQNSQAEQLTEVLIDRAGQTGRPVFLGCDCNTRSNNRTNKILSEALTDPTRELGWPLRRSALPGTRHERRIAHLDYIWYRPGPEQRVQVDGIFRVTDRGGSDHHPLVADFSLPPTD